MGASLRRALVPALVVLALAAVVAIAAGGSLPGGSSAARAPSDTLLDTFFSLLLVALVPAVILLVYGLMQRREVAERYTTLRRRRRDLALLVALVALVAAIYFRRPGRLLFPGPSESAPVLPKPPPGQAPSPVTDHPYEPSFAWLPVSVVLFLVVAGAAAWYLSSRRRTQGSRDESAAETLASVLDDTLDDLRAEADPRRAVIAAYARLERALGAHGFPRRPSETAEELLVRVLGALEVGSASVRRLTDLFERAKFSPHEVNLEMKEEAITALETVRDELREADARRAAVEAAARAVETPA